MHGLREFQREGLPWWVGGDLVMAEQDFATFVGQRLAESSQRADTLVPKTHLWAVMDDKFVGRISIHHELTDALRVEGGHIGYDTVPSFRNRGVASEMLRQALPRARAQTGLYSSPRSDAPRSDHAGAGRSCRTPRRVVSTLAARPRPPSVARGRAPARSVEAPRAVVLIPAPRPSPS